MIEYAAYIHGTWALLQTYRRSLYDRCFSIVPTVS